MQQALMKIGYNVLEFQRIEHCLKIVAPYLVTQPDRNTDRPALIVKQLLADRKTLGPLVQRLKDANQIEDKAAFEKYVNEVLDHRNNLVHHFLMRDDALLDTEDKCRSVIAYLDQQRQFIQPMATLAKDYVAEFISALDEADNVS